VRAGEEWGKWWTGFDEVGKSKWRWMGIWSVTDARRTS